MTTISTVASRASSPPPLEPANPLEPGSPDLGTKGLENPSSLGEPQLDLGVGATRPSDNAIEATNGITNVATQVVKLFSKPGPDDEFTNVVDSKISSTKLDDEGSGSAGIGDSEESPLQGSTAVLVTDASAIPVQIAGSSTQSLGPDEPNDVARPDLTSNTASSAHQITGFPSQATAFPPSITTAGTVATRNSFGQYVIGTQTLIPGASGFTVDGTIVSIPLSATEPVSDVWTLPLVTSGEHQDVVLDAFTFNRGSGGYLVAGTQTLTPGSPAITISGTPISLAVSGTAIIVGSAAEAHAKPQSEIVATIDGFTFTRASGPGLVIGTQTITSGSPALFVSGTPISLAVSATALVVGSSTTELVPLSRHGSVTIDGFMFTDGPGSGLIIGTQTVMPGSPAVTVSGTVISLPPSGPFVVIAGSSFTVPFNTGQPTVLDIAGSSYTETGGSAFIVGSQTLIPGGSAITVNGTPISLAPSGTAVLVGTQAESLSTAKQGMGDVIMSAFGEGGIAAPGSTTESNVTGFTGGASRYGPQRLHWVLMLVVLIMVKEFT
ncbi:MAG: hypothetical protein Q9169_002996 [Polycauliona sp. 2 TL-2023]